MPLITQYHFHVKNHTRSGKSIFTCVAYRSCGVMHDSNTGKTYDYTKKGEHGKLVDSGIMLPKDAPQEYLDRQTLWNEIDKSETNANARLAREFEVSIPIGLNREQQIAVTKEFCQSLVDEGMIVDYAIHNPKADNSNPHIHILCSTRPIDAKTGKFCVKEKKVYALDKDGNKIPIIDPLTGKQKIGARGRKLWKRTTVQTNPFNAKENIKRWRKQWEIVANNALERAGVNSQIDCRSYQDRGLDIIPCFGEGAEQYMRERGVATVKDVRPYNEEIKLVNTEVLEAQMQQAYDKVLVSNNNLDYYLDYLDKVVTYNSYIKAPLQLNVVASKDNNTRSHDYPLMMAYVGATNNYLQLSFEKPRLQAIYEAKKQEFKEKLIQVKTREREASFRSLIKELFPVRQLHLLKKPITKAVTIIPRRLMKFAKTVSTTISKLFVRRQLKLARKVTAPFAELEPILVKAQAVKPTSTQTSVPSITKQPEQAKAPQIERQEVQPKPKPFNVAQYLLELEQSLLNSRYDIEEAQRIKDSVPQQIYANINDFFNFIMANELLKQDLIDEYEYQVKNKEEDLTKSDEAKICATVLLAQVQAKVEQQELNLPKYLQSCGDYYSKLNFIERTNTECEESIKKTLSRHFKAMCNFVLANNELRSELMEYSPYFAHKEQYEQVRDITEFLFTKFVENHEDVELYQSDVPIRKQLQSKVLYR